MEIIINNKADFRLYYSILMEEYEKNHFIINDYIIGKHNTSMPIRHSNK